MLKLPFPVELLQHIRLLEQFILQLIKLLGRRLRWLQFELITCE